MATHRETLSKEEEQGGREGKKKIHPHICCIECEREGGDMGVSFYPKDKVTYMCLRDSETPAGFTRIGMEENSL